MTIKLEIKKTEVTEQEVDLPVPCFFRNKAETTYVGLLDEFTVVEMVADEYENSIRNFNNKTWKTGIDRVKFAYNEYVSCTETEFLDKYSEVERAMSLHPILVP